MGQNHSFLVYKDNKQRDDKASVKTAADWFSVHSVSG